ncbi:ComF family protein, partial [Streptomyces somaliensis DSM 40738]|nr:ComF family protein [Streptomyces somaliensis DSM 40738]
MRGWWQEITGLVLPVTCAGCGRARTVLCDACTRSLHGRPAVRVRPEPEPPGLPGVWAAAPYADAVRAALLAHKERGALALAAPLGAALAGAVRAAAVGRAEADGRPRGAE